MKIILEVLISIRNIMVTGDAGFIGANFRNYLLETYPGMDHINITEKDNYVVS